ncbi:MAG TPA: VWA domain-containing protein [Verrucomicrobiales bacterium]|nr:VWA domain-containing protein [Verrucomicrobiales bacterium]
MRPFAGAAALGLSLIGLLGGCSQPSATPGLSANYQAVPTQGNTVPSGARQPAMPGEALSLAAPSPSSSRFPFQFGPAPVDRESYAAVEENPYFSVANEPLSTFSIDVDTASYANVRRLLQNGLRVPPGAVRIEEMVNYFDYRYPEPEGEVPFSVSAETASCPWMPQHRLMRIGLRGRPMPKRNLPPANLVFLIDVSGSMSDANKLPLVKSSLRLLLDELDPKDRVALVVYAGTSGLVLDSTPVSERRRILDALEGLEAGGSTAGAEGIQLAYQVASKHQGPGVNSRVILATDGDFNVGITDESQLERLIKDRARSGVYFTVLGYGMGNYQDDRLELLADKGNGNYAYVDTLQEARKVLVREMGSTLLTIAKDVKIQVEFNPAQAAAYRLIGYENRKLEHQDFHDDKKDAGEIGADHTVTAYYEIVPAGQAAPGLKMDALKYSRPPEAAAAAESGELATIKLRYKPPQETASKLITHVVRDKGETFEQSSRDFQFGASVAAFGMLLRDSQHKGNTTFGRIREWARAGQTDDPHGDRAEFLALLQ